MHQNQAMLYRQVIRYQVCPISGPIGPWDRFQMRDLPHGDCSGTQACSIQTEDLPRNELPGSGNYVAMRMPNSGTWRCDEQERTKAAC